MPIHEYACRDGGNQFETLVRSADKRKLSVFATQGATPEPAACGTCGDPRGPGACRLN